MTLDCGAEPKMRRACGFHKKKKCMYTKHCAYQIGRNSNERKKQ